MTPPLGATDIPLSSVVAQLRWWRRLLDSETWGRAAIERAQVVALDAIVAHARSRVPLYADLPAPWTGGGGLRDRLRSLPYTERGTLQRASWPERLSGAVPAASRTLQSTGSSGRPLDVIYPPGFTRWQGLIAMRMDRAAGLGVRPRRLNLAPHQDRRARRQHLHRLLWRRSVLRLDEASEQDLIAGVLAHRPDVLGGFPHMLAVVGRALDGALRPSAVLTHGETVDEVVRAELRTLFGTPPIDRYGTSEVAAVAYQCAARDVYHLNHESALVEVLDPDGEEVAPGDTGEVVVTSLANPLMPVIRYRTEDLATRAPRPCRCGHAGPAIARFVGRTMDSLRRADGTIVLPHQLWVLLQDGGQEVAPVLDRYQVHQRGDGSVDVLLDLRARPDAAALARLTASYERVLGPGVPVRVRPVDDLEPGGAKFRLVRRDVVTHP